MPIWSHNDSIQDFEVEEDSSWFERTVPVVLNVVFLILTVWLFLSLLHYGKKTNKWKRNPTSNLEKLNVGVVYSFVIVCAILCLIQFVLNLVFVFVGFSKDDEYRCEAISDTTATCYGLILWSVFMFLWFRQKTFYLNKMLCFKMSAGIKFFSISSIVLINISGLTYVVLFTFPNNYKPSPVGCTYKPEDNSLKDYYGIYVVLCLAMSHLMLLGLFTYPLLLSGKNPMLYRFRKPRKSSRSLSCSSIENNRGLHSTTNFSRRSLSISPSANGIKRLLRKTLIFATLSISMEALIQVCFHYTSASVQHVRINVLIFNVAAFFNLLFLVFSFATSKEILLTFCRKPAAIHRVMPNSV